MKIKYVLATIVSLCLVCVFLMTMPASVLAADNLAVNGDLEMGNDNGWKLNNATIAPAEYWDVHSGNYALCLNPASDYFESALKTVPVGKNATVTVSLYYTYWGYGEFHVYTYKGADTSVGAYTDGADASLAYSFRWKKISYTFNSGDYDYITLKFCPVGADDRCTIDDLVVTAVGGAPVEEDPYLTSFGTKYNRPKNDASNLLVNGGFESAGGAQWNTNSFIKGNLSVVADSTAPEGSKSLYFDSGNVTTPVWHTFPVTVERNTIYTFSAWVKSPRLSAINDATATFGVMNAETGKFLVYEPYNGNGYGSASLSTETMQLMATSPDGEWHLRSVTFNSGSHTTLYIGVYGAESQLYLDDVALYKSAYGMEYISDLRAGSITARENTGNKYCADEDSLVPNPQMSGQAAKNHWSSNPAWRNGFLSFKESADEHGTVLKYSSESGLGLTYVDWIDVEPNTSYTFTVDVCSFGYTDNSRIALLDDNPLSPAEFYSIYFEYADDEWLTYSITFNTGVYSRIGLAIMDFGGEAMIDNVRLFETSRGIADEPEDVGTPTLKPTGGKTSVMEMVAGPTNVVGNGGFEDGFNSFDVYQFTTLSADAAHSGANGAHLKGDGGWGAMVEKTNIPVKDGKTYTVSYWYKANASGANISVIGTDSGVQYAYVWASRGQWTNVTATFTVDGDTSVRFNACGSGTGVAEDVYLDDISIMENTEGLLGIAFLMELQAYNVTRNEQGVANLNNATVDVFGNDGRYRLVQMGAVMTNKAWIGTNKRQFTREYAVDGNVVLVDIPAKYLNSTDRFSTNFAVRVINVPTGSADVVIYARPYYVFEKDGELFTVYGDIYSRSYNDPAISMD